MENGLEVPALFKDKGYVESTHFRFGLGCSCARALCRVKLPVRSISSSNTNPGYNNRVGGFGPVCNDGYGTCYNTSAKSINVRTRLLCLFS